MENEKQRKGVDLSERIATVSCPYLVWKSQWGWCRTSWVTNVYMVQSNGSKVWLFRNLLMADWSRLVYGTIDVAGKVHSVIEKAAEHAMRAILSLIEPDPTPSSMLIHRCNCIGLRLQLTREVLESLPPHLPGLHCCEAKLQGWSLTHCKRA